MVEQAVAAIDGGKEYQFESIKQKIEAIVDQVVHSKCGDIAAYDPKLGQAWSNDIAEDIVRRA